MVHSDLRRFGIVRNTRGQLGLALEPEILHQALRKTLGPGATIVAATFTYSWTRGLTYSPANSRGVEGSFGEYLRRLPGARRSAHPMMSVAADGPGAAELVEGNDDTSFGSDSPFARMHRADTRHLTVGVDVCSFADYVQWACSVPYRYRKRFRGRIDANGRRLEAECEHYVRFVDEGLETQPIFEVLDPDDSGRIRRTELREVLLRVVSSKDLFDMMRDRLESDRYAFSTRPDDEATLTFLGCWLADGSNRPRVVAVDQDGEERWIWFWPPALSPDKIGFPTAVSRTASAGISTVAVQALPGESEPLVGDDIEGHRVSSADMTTELLQSMRWLMVSGEGLTVDRADPKSAPWEWIALMSRRGIPGARQAIDIAAEWLAQHPVEPASGFGGFLLQRLIGQRPTALMTRLDEGELLRLPLLQPEIRGSEKVLA